MPPATDNDAMPRFRIIFSLRTRTLLKVNRWGNREEKTDVTTEILPYDDLQAARDCFQSLTKERRYNGGHILNMHLEQLKDTLLGPSWNRILTSEPMLQ